MTSGAGRRQRGPRARASRHASSSTADSSMPRKVADSLLLNPATGETARRDVGGHRGGHRSCCSCGEARYSSSGVVVANGAASAHGDPVSVRDPGGTHAESLAVLETLDMGKPIADVVAVDLPARHRHHSLHGGMHRQDRRRASPIPKPASCTWCCASRSASSARSRRGTTRC